MSNYRRLRLSRARRKERTMKHEIVEKNIALMIILIIVALSFGTLVELSLIHI